MTLIPDFDRVRVMIRNKIRYTIILKNTTPINYYRVSDVYRFSTKRRMSFTLFYRFYWICNGYVAYNIIMEFVNIYIDAPVNSLGSK